MVRRGIERGRVEPPITRRLCEADGDVISIGDLKPIFKHLQSRSATSTVWYICVQRFVCSICGCNEDGIVKMY